MAANTYPGIDQDTHGGMTFIGKIIKDGWVFGIIPETETCAGWTFSRIENLQQQVNQKWEEYGLLPSRLPPDLRERHDRIHGEAIERARKLGWDPELGDDD